MPTLDLNNYVEFAQDEYEPDVTDNFDPRSTTLPTNNWDNSCGEHTPGEEWVCNRDQGHLGPHVAAYDISSGSEVVAVWDQGRNEW